MQMIKINYGDKRIWILHFCLESRVVVDSEKSLKLFYTGNSKLLLSVLDMMEKNKGLEQIYIYTDHVNKLKKDFFSLFRLLKAAGGLVLNKESDVLMIFRRGHWDLPKGKLEEEESKKEGAIREVKEETGLVNLEILGKLKTTYHIYRNGKGLRILKPTYWYFMYSPDENLFPQTDEDIEKAVWVTGIERNLKNYTPMYSSITDIMNEHIVMINEFR